MKITPNIFALTIFALVGCFSFANAKTSERPRLLQACSREFGAAVDKRQNLFNVNQDFALHLKFNRRGSLFEFEIQPKYFFIELRPEWREIRSVPRLSFADFKDLVARLDSVKPMGRLTEEGKPSPIVTSETRYFTEPYERTLLRWGEVGIRGQPDNQIRFFTVHYLPARHRRPLSRHAR